MSTLTRKLQIGEYLQGYLKSIDIEENETSSRVPFFYRHPNKEEVDKILEKQNMKGFLIGKSISMIYTSEPLNFKHADVLELETESIDKKVMAIAFDHKKSRKTDMRLQGVRNKTLYLGKLITLE